MEKTNKVLRHPLMRGLYHIAGACTAAGAIGIPGISPDLWIPGAGQPVAFGVLGLLGAHSLIKRVMLMQKEGFKAHFLPGLAHAGLTSAFISQVVPNMVVNVLTTPYSLVPLAAGMVAVRSIRRARIAIRRLTTTEETKASK